MEILNSHQSLSSFFPSSSNWNFGTSDSLSPRKRQGIKRKYCDGEFIEEQRPQKLSKMQHNLKSQYPTLSDSFVSSPFASSESTVRLSGKKRSSACLEPSSHEYSVEIPVPQRPKYNPASDSIPEVNLEESTNNEKSLILLPNATPSFFVDSKALASSRQLILSCWNSNNNMTCPSPPSSLSGEHSQIVPFHPIPRPLSSYPSTSQNFEEEHSFSSRNRVVEITEEEEEELLRSEKASPCLKRGYLVEEEEGEEEPKEDTNAMELD